MIYPHPIRKKDENQPRLFCVRRVAHDGVVAEGVAYGKDHVDIPLILIGEGLGEGSLAYGGEIAGL